MTEGNIKIKAAEAPGSVGTHIEAHPVSRNGAAAVEARRIDVRAEADGHAPIREGSGFHRASCGNPEHENEYACARERVTHCGACHGCSLRRRLGGTQCFASPAAR